MLKFYTIKPPYLIQTIAITVNLFYRKKTLDGLQTRITTKTEGWSHLNDGRIIGKTSSKGWLRFRRFAHPDVLDVSAPEYDVLIHLQASDRGFFHIMTRLIQNIPHLLAQQAGQLVLPLCRRTSLKKS